MKKNKFIVALASVAFMVAFVIGLHAGTQDKTVGGTTGYPANVRGKTFLLERTLDFSLSDNTGTAADIYQMINIPAKTFVMAVGAEIETVEDSACTLELGDDANASGFYAGAGATSGAPAVVWSQASTNAFEQGKLYTAADTLDMTLNNNADTLKITVRALCVPVGGTE